jgi:Na+-transporting NADH:ubiquinone oxidoreductase subunit A
MIKIKKGLDLPIAGKPNQETIQTYNASTVALVGADYWWFKPTMAVKEGDIVKKGQLLFSCKKEEGIRFTATASGTVKAINRGDRRSFQSLVIEVKGDESVTFENYKGADLETYSTEETKALLIESGMWTSLRSRPFSYIARLSEMPKAIFVTAMDTNPLSLDPTIVINEHLDAFNKGINVLSKLAKKVFVCTAPGVDVVKDVASNVVVEQFSGPHPAGNVGTHIHHLAPVTAEKVVWHLGYQDLISIGKLFESGEIFNERVIALGGPMARNPRLIKTQTGACISKLTRGEFYPFGDTRIISGSVFNGRTLEKNICYLGKYHNQITLIKEGVEREFLGWHSPGINKFSVKPIYISHLIQQLLPKRLFSFTTSTNGSDRSLVPIGSFEKVMPLDIVATYLLRSLLSNDRERAQELGCLELDEEDLALCTFVDPCKHEFGQVLRSNLEHILKEG